MSQDIISAVRPVLFDTSNEYFPYSFGGTLFIISLRGRCYGLTCYHVTRDQAERIIIFKTKAPKPGDLPVPVQTLARVDSLDNDLGDVVVLGFSDEIDSSCFQETAYSITQDAIGTSWVGDRLRVFGCLNTKSSVDTESKSITIGFCDLKFHALGCGASDPFLWQASSTLAMNNFASLDGISGAPVFNETQGRLCGMVTRAGLNASGKATLWYIDILDVIKFAEAVHGGSSRLDYLKYPLK